MSERGEWSNRLDSLASIPAVRSFTRDDIVTIRANVEGFRHVARVVGMTKRMEVEMAKLLRIADRIEALL